MARDDAMWAILTDPSKRNHGWRQDEFFATGEAFVDWLFRAFDDHGIRIERGAALDFGCGLGRLTRPLATRGFRRVLGLDISAEMISKARELLPAGSGIEFLVNTDILPVEASAFDYVQSQLVLQHLHPDLILLYLSEFARALRPGGVLYFQLPISLTGSTGITHIKNPIDTSSGTVSMEMSAMPRNVVERELEARGFECCFIQEGRQTDGMHWAIYIARRR